MADRNICINLLRILITISLAAVFIYVVIERQYVYDQIGIFTKWMAIHPYLGPFTLSTVMMLGEIFFLPGSLLTIGAGFAFKRAYNHSEFALVVGSISAWVGISIGAVITMLLGRFVFKEQAKKMSHRYPIIKALDKAIETEGLKLIFLMRMCPLIPFTLFNFAIGITGMKLSDYCVGMLAVIPSTVAYVFLGTTISDIEDAIQGKNNFSDNLTLMLFVIIGSILAIVGLIYITVVANSILKKMMEESESDEEKDKKESNSDQEDSKLPRASTQAAEELFKEEDDGPVHQDETSHLLKQD